MAQRETAGARVSRLDKLFNLARYGSSDELQLSACISFLDRVLGKPLPMGMHRRAANLSTLDDADLGVTSRLAQNCTLRPMHDPIAFRLGYKRGFRNDNRQVRRDGD